MYNGYSISDALTFYLLYLFKESAQISNSIRQRQHLESRKIIIYSIWKIIRFEKKTQSSFDLRKKCNVMKRWCRHMLTYVEDVSEIIE